MEETETSSFTGAKIRGSKTTSQLSEYSPHHSSFCGDRLQNTSNMIRRSIELRDNPRSAASAGIPECEISKHSTPTIHCTDIL